jgi:CheY-like chemotaxis protein
LQENAHKKKSRQGSVAGVWQKNFFAMAKAILLAEDSQDDEQLFKHVLKKSRVENPVVVVRDGAEAIKYLEGTGRFADRTRHPLPDILFLDLKMPGTDGFAVLEWLQEQPAVKEGLLVVVLTHFDDHYLIERAYNLGAHSFLAKPIMVEELENLIRHFNGRWKRSDTAEGETL